MDRDARWKEIFEEVRECGGGDNGLLTLFSKIERARGHQGIGIEFVMSPRDGPERYIHLQWDSNGDLSGSMYHRADFEGDSADGSKVRIDLAIPCGAKQGMQLQLVFALYKNGRKGKLSITSDEIDGRIINLPIFEPSQVATSPFARSVAP